MPIAQPWLRVSCSGFSLIDHMVLLSGKTDYVRSTQCTLLENLTHNINAQLYVTKFSTRSHYVTKLFVTNRALLQFHHSYTAQSDKIFLTVDIAEIWLQARIDRRTIPADIPTLDYRQRNRQKKIYAYGKMAGCLHNNLCIYCYKKTYFLPLVYFTNQHTIQT